MRKRVLSLARTISCRVLRVLWLLMFIPSRVIVELFQNFVWAPKRTANPLSDDFFQTALHDRKLALRNGLKHWWNVTPQSASVLLHRKLATELLVPISIQVFVQDVLGRQISRTSVISTPLAGARICDVQCGAGFSSEGLVAAGAAVTAIDEDDNLIMIARAHWQKIKGRAERPRYMRMSPGDLGKQPMEDLYDLVICSQPLNHTMDWQTTLRDSAKLVRKGGCLIVTGPNRTFLSFLWHIIVLEHCLRIATSGSFRFNRFVKTEEIAVQVKKDAGLKIISCNGSYVKGSSRRRFKWTQRSSTDVWYTVVIKKLD